MNAAFSYVRESLGYSAVHERLRRQGDLSTLNPGFQQIAHIETDLNMFGVTYAFAAETEKRAR